MYNKQENIGQLEQEVLETDPYEFKFHTFEPYLEKNTETKY